VLVALSAAPETETLAEQLAGLELVLTKRRSDLRRHAGEISFPGGRWERSDRSLYDTALREAEEEIGLPRGELTPLGALAPTHTFSTNYTVHPFVGLIERAGEGEDSKPPDAALAKPRAWNTSTQEVQDVLELSLGDLRAGRGRTRLERRGIRFETDAYTVGEHLIWGVTSRIIDDLLERLARID
jgi:ADP-ribose pyrophosphatase YjhB (NUDIX family)